MIGASLASPGWRRGARRGTGRGPSSADFAHLHAVTDGGFTHPEAFIRVLDAAETAMEPDAPFHIHFSDISFVNRNERAHLRYGQGTLRAEPLAKALPRFARPATVIGESPDEASNQAIRAVLVGDERGRSRPMPSSIRH